LSILDQDLDTHSSKGPWIVGFSHGVDSSTLLLLLEHWAKRRGAPPIHPIHVDHGLRPESASEASRALGFCKDLGLPGEIHRLTNLGSGEGRARAARYEIFRQRARELGASLLFLAHHRDDDLETLLFRFLRGTGALGLAAIPSLRLLDPGHDLSTRVYRPLLGFEKRELVAWLEARGQDWIEDPSNARADHSPRNRIRHDLLPHIRRDPRAWQALSRLSQEAERFAALVHEEIRSLPMPLVPEICWSVEPLAELSPWAFERYLTLVLERMRQPRPSRPHLRQARALLRPGVASGKCVESRGRWRLERRKRELHLRVLAV